VTSHAAAPAAASPDASRAAFIRSRLASLLAIFPLGVWVMLHLWNNLSAFQGADAWQASVTQYPHPLAQALSGVVVLLPLALHTVWGFARLRTARVNLGRYSYYANLKYVLQRLAGLGVFFFVGAHLWLAFLKPRATEGHPEAFADIAQEMHFHTPTLVVYLLGTLGVAYHLANGAHTFCMSWGIVSSRKGLRRLEASALLFFALLLAMSWGAIYALYTAGGPATL